jgi:hypothetical protein
MAYTYDPSQGIKQGFQQAKMDVGNIFTQVIAQQQRDYTLAENAFQNIEALKKNLNIFGQKNVTEKSNNLLKEASSAILANGKLDYSKLGEIRQKVSDIADLKQGYDLGAKEYERMLQLGIANKDNMVSFEKFYKDLSAKMGDENLVKNPQDLQRALADTYSNNLDASAMFGKSFLKQNPLKPVSQDIRNAKGDVVGIVKGEIPSTYSIGANGKAIFPPAITVTGPDGQPRTLDFIDQQLQNVQQNNPDLWNLMKKQTGFGGTMMNERAIMETYLSKIPSTLSIHETKSEKELRMQEAQVKSAEFQAKVLPQEFAAKMRNYNASTTASELSSKKSQLEIDALKGQNKSSSNLGTYTTEFNITTKDKSGKDITTKIAADGANLGKPMKITVPTIKGDMSLNITDITYDKNGTARVAYLEPAPKGSTNLPSVNLESDGTPAGATIKYATVSSKQLGRFLSAVKQGIGANVSDNTDAAKTWNRVQSIFTPKLTPEQQKQVDIIKNTPANKSAIENMDDLQIWQLIEQQRK